MRTEVEEVEAMQNIREATEWIVTIMWMWCIFWAAMTGCMLASLMKVSPTIAL